MEPAEFGDSIYPYRLMAVRPGTLDRLYRTKHWQRVRRHQLLVQPLCEMCQQHGISRPATCVDHIVPHRNDVNAFWFNPLQSLCASCHSGPKRCKELRGYERGCDVHGYPLDPNHPVWGGWGGRDPNS
jgi:5-methylcytosine-specific restriction enzyme A